MIMTVNNLARLVPRRFASADKEIARRPSPTKKGRQARARRLWFWFEGKI
jgi:hypothetical protein